MAVFGSLNGVLGVDKGAWTKGMQAAGDEAVAMQKKSSSALKQLDQDAKAAGGSYLERLAQKEKAENKEKRSTGESALEGRLRSGEFFLDKIGAGGIKGVITDFAGRAFAGVAEKAVEVRDAIREGRQDWKGAVNEIAQGVPVLGPWVKGFNAIRELITGERAEIEATNAAAQRMNQISDSMGRGLKIQKEAWAGIRQIVSDVNERLAVMSLEGFAKQAHEVEAGFQKQIEAAKKSKEEKAKALDDEYAIQEKLRLANIQAIAEATEEKASGYWRNVGRKTQIGKIWIDSSDDVMKAGQNEIDGEHVVIDRIRKEREAKKKALLGNNEAEIALEKEKQARLAKIAEESAKAHADKLKSIQEKIDESGIAYRKTLLEAAGDADTVAIEEIVRKYKSQAEAALKDVQDSLKQRGISETSEIGRQEISAAQVLGMRLGDQAEAERYKYMKGARDNIVSTLDPEMKFQEDLAKLKRAYDRGLISAEELAKAKTKLQESAAGGIIDSIKTPEEKFITQIQELRAKYSAGILDATQTARAAVLATQGLNDELASRRPQINLGGVQGRTSFDSRPDAGPKVASPLENISKTAKDQLKALTDLAKISADQLAEARKAVNVTVSLN